MSGSMAKGKGDNRILKVRSRALFNKSKGGKDEKTLDLIYHPHCFKFVYHLSKTNHVGSGKVNIELRSMQGRNELESSFPGDRFS